MLTIQVDREVAGVLTPAYRRQFRVEVSRMVLAAARSEGRKQLEVGLRLTDDAGIWQLNRAYRKRNKPTDVLAFAQREGPGAMALPELLGDIVISLPTARAQAKRRGAAGLHAELMHLAAHGLCHLLGYDHQNDADELEMNTRAAALIAESRRRGLVRSA